MKKLTKRIAAMAAAVIMTASLSSVGASAVVLDNGPKTYNGTFFKMSCITQFTTTNSKNYARNLTTSKSSTKRWIAADAYITTKNGTKLKTGTAGKALSLGDILTPSATSYDSTSYYGKYESRAYQDNTPKVKVESKPLSLAIRKS